MIVSPLPRLDQFRRQRAERHRLASNLYDRILDLEFYVTNADAVRRTIARVENEPLVYGSLFDETMPTHLQGALDRERDLWTYFHGLLRITPVDEDRYDALCTRLQPLARTLDDLL